ncbi:MAG TPA: DnaB-like helicase C-terminal domain-containing protein, partial [Phycisphaerae bacterium]|nr:DnaB-like helicase C-terminal domain-containing protein [Phycisphaerae bacterium]
DPKARRYDQLVQISRSLKLLANELGIPLLVLAQLNAESQSTERTPGITDIADCKAIARDANCVLILDRPVERHKSNPTWLRMNAGNLTAATIDVAAIRNGQPAVIQCHYIGETQRCRQACGRGPANALPNSHPRAITATSTPRRLSAAIPTADAVAARLFITRSH